VNFDRHGNAAPPKPAPLYTTAGRALRNVVDVCPEPGSGPAAAMFVRAIPPDRPSIHRAGRRAIAVGIEGSMNPRLLRRKLETVPVLVGNKSPPNLVFPRRMQAAKGVSPLAAGPARGPADISGTLLNRAFLTDDAVRSSLVWSKSRSKKMLSRMSRL
jgi:hypothetical protein